MGGLFGAGALTHSDCSSTHIKTIFINCKARYDFAILDVPFTRSRRVARRVRATDGGISFRRLPQSRKRRCRRFLRFAT